MSYPILMLKPAISFMKCKWGFEVWEVEENNLLWIRLTADDMTSVHRKCSVLTTFLGVEK